MVCVILADMALIRQFEHRPSASVGFRSEVDCGWAVGDAHGRRLLHLETYGSSARAIPGKVSQSIELDEDGARELVGIISRAFPDLSV